MPEKILIIDDDVDTLRLVGLMLQRQGYQIVAASDGPKGLTVANSEIPDLILLDVMMPGMDGYEVARRLRFNAATANIPILMFTAKAQLDDKVTGFEAGADDYLTKPTHPAELQAHVKALLARSSKARTPNPPTNPTEPRAYVIGVLSARSGQGTTTVAVNLATSLVRKAIGDVILAEFRPGQGTVGMELGLASTGAGLSGLLKASPADITRASLRDELVTHACGLKVLPASYQPRDAALIANTPQFEAILQKLAYLGTFVVVDLGPGLPEYTQLLAKTMSDIFIVSEPTSTASVHTHAIIDDLVSLGVQRDRMTVVGNSHTWLSAPIPQPQLQEKLGIPVSAYILSAPELMASASRAKTPAILTQSESPFTKQIIGLARMVLDRAPKSHRK